MSASVCVCVCLRSALCVCSSRPPFRSHAKRTSRALPQGLKKKKGGKKDKGAAPSDPVEEDFLYMAEKLTVGCYADML